MVSFSITKKKLKMACIFNLRFLFFLILSPFFKKALRKRGHENEISYVCKHIISSTFDKVKSRHTGRKEIKR